MYICLTFPLFIDIILKFLVIMNSTIVNMGMHMSLQQNETISFGYTPSIGVGRPYGCSIFNFFLGITIMFSILAAEICIPANNVHCFIFPHILANSCYALSLKRIFFVLD